ncbi:kinase-like protein [Ramaria rubella]|nr:kinase-like protein [Ramaria rubella]KAF8578265.1 kinase-like protein [Ramaria rubella]
MKFPLIHKKPLNPEKLAHRRLLLTDPNSLIGYRIDDGHIGHIKLMSVLGVGGNGVVYHAVECFLVDTPQSAEPRQFAVKALSKVGLEPRQVKTLEREFEMHMHVSGHPNIVTFHGIIEEDDFFFVLLDYVPGGDIFDMMDLHRAYVGNDELIKSVFLQLIDAVEHIHGLGISHRDIKPENILCKDGGSRIMLADFGLGTDRKVVRDYGLGSEPYMAPQCFGGFWRKLGPYSTPHADIWSLGVVLVNLACARNPWHKATEESGIYKQYLTDPNFLMQILPISSELNEVLKRMFTINPQARISLRDLRIKVQAIKRFALTDEELKQASPVVRSSVKRARDAQGQGPKLTPDAPHSAAASQIRNLTAEDIGRLETEAREDARDASLQYDQEARQSLFADADLDNVDDDVDDYPLFVTPTFSPALTIVVKESTPRAADAVTLNNDEAVFVLHDGELYSDLDSDGSDSDVDSDVPVTPESRPAADDVDIMVIPEISLDGPIHLHEVIASDVTLSKMDEIMPTLTPIVKTTTQKSESSEKKLVVVK